MLYLPYFLLCLIVFISFIQYKKYFILLFFVVLLIQPIFQKFLDPTIYGDTLRDVTLGRISTNLFFLLFFLISIPKIRFKTSNTTAKNFVFIFLFILLNFLSVIFSQDFKQSFYLFLIAVIQPCLFYIVLISIDEQFYTDLSWLNKSIGYIILFCFCIGIVYIIYDGGFNRVFITLRARNGIWTNNYSLQILSLLFPIAIYGDYNGRKIFKLFIIGSILLMELIALSRTSTVVLLIQVILMIYWRLLKSKRLIYGLIIIIIVTAITSIILNTDIIDTLISRFEMGGRNIIDSFKNDPRFYIYKISLPLIKDNWLFGIGLGNFYDVKFNYDGFSDCHNLFISVFVMRGILVLIMVIYAFYYFFKRNYQYAKCENIEPRRFLLCLRIGMIGFLLSSLTGSDLFIYSGLCNAWPMYFLIFLFVLQEKIYNMNLHNVNGAAKT